MNIFDHFHNVAHPGSLASRRIISSRFVCLSSDITAWARGCLACQRGKIHRHTHLVPLPIPIPQRRFSHLHVDLVGHCSTVIVLIIFFSRLVSSKTVEIRPLYFPPLRTKLYTDFTLRWWRIFCGTRSRARRLHSTPPSLEAGAERRSSIPAEAACHGEGAEPLRAERSPDEA